MHVAELVDSGEVGIDQATEALRLLGQACGSLPHALLELSMLRMNPTGALGLVCRWLASSGDAWRRDLGRHRSSRS